MPGDMFTTATNTVTDAGFGEEAKCTGPQSVEQTTALLPGFFLNPPGLIELAKPNMRPPFLR